MSAAREPNLPRPPPNSLDAWALFIERYEDIIEGAGELGVSVANEKADLVPSSARLITRFLACWVTKEESGLVVATVTCTRRAPISMKNRT